eukprot:1330042-Amorphochlora_amoeboformis.AAC.1
MSLIRLVLVRADVRLAASLPVGTLRYSPPSGEAEAMSWNQKIRRPSPSSFSAENLTGACSHSTRTSKRVYHPNKRGCGCSDRPALPWLYAGEQRGICTPNWQVSREDNLNDGSDYLHIAYRYGGLSSVTPQVALMSMAFSAVRQATSEAEGLPLLRPASPFGLNVRLGLSLLVSTLIFGAIMPSPQHLGEFFFPEGYLAQSGFSNPFSSPSTGIFLHFAAHWLERGVGMYSEHVARSFVKYALRKYVFGGWYIRPEILRKAGGAGGLRVY